MSCILFTPCTLLSCGLRNGKLAVSITYSMTPHDLRGQDDGRRRSAGQDTDGPAGREGEIQTYP